MSDFVENTYKFPEMIVLGSTGSVGEQAVDVAVKHGIRVTALSANKDVKRIEEQARTLSVTACAMADAAAAADLKQRLADTSIRVYSGADGICQMLADVKKQDRQVVQNAIMGRAGLEPTLTSLQLKYRLALANKESLVVAGKQVMACAAENGAEIVPVDSEHSAIYQCLRAGNRNEVQSILLTASGGPFYGKKACELENVTAADALRHPTWKMGAKITVDSASMMNKGFEVIEASYLFHVPAEQIRVLVHRESIVHSMVEFTDNVVMAQLSVPDMRECVQYAMTDPYRVSSVTQRLDLAQIGKLTFTEPDNEAFPLLQCAKWAMGRGGAYPAVLNAANEVAVDAFLKEKIGFRRLMDVVMNAAQAVPSDVALADDLDTILSWDLEARRLAESMIKGESR